MNAGKIFCIGFQKTGTSSVGAALRILGYRVCGAVGLREPELPENIRRIAFGEVEKYDAFQDNPWPILYRELYERYPDSKFILTVRPVDAWIRSEVKHFGTDFHSVHEWIYGAGWPKGNEDIYIERYQRHNADVREFFKHKADNFLELDICGRKGWEVLCPFLGREVPEMDFPHSNENRRTARMLSRSKKFIRRNLKKIGV